jgi:hypothetical protein
MSMQHRTKIRRATLAAGVALGVMFAAATEAKPIKHHAQAAGPTKAEVELKAQVDTLKAEVQALETRLDTQVQTQQQSQAQIQAAQTQAQAAQTQAQAAQTQVQAAQTQIQTLPDQVKTEVAAAQPKTFYGNWFGNTKVGATIFSDVGGVNNFSNGIRQSNSGVDYDIKRFYLSIDHKFNDIFSMDLTTDFTYNNSVTVPAGDSVGTPPSGTKPAGTAVPCSTSSSTTSAPNCASVAATQLYIKKAYLQASLSDAINFRVGSAELPWVPFVESLNGYRYVENMMIDRTKFGTTTDWGVHMFGTLANNIISYQVSAVDGFGYKHPAIGGTQARSDYVDVEGRVSATYDHFTVGVGGYEGKLGKDIVGTSNYRTADRFDAVAAYVDRKIRLGVEYFYAKNWNDVTQINPSLTNISSGVGGFGSFNFTDRVAVFGRYDYVAPQRDTAPAFKDHYFNVGLSYAPIIRFAANAPDKPIKVLDFALVYKREAVDDGLISTSNGIIGGSDRGTYDEIGLFSYVNF